jgi:hypothetical protein
VHPAICALKGRCTAAGVYAVWPGPLEVCKVLLLLLSGFVEVLARVPALLGYQPLANPQVLTRNAVYLVFPGF